MKRSIENLCALAALLILAGCGGMGLGQMPDNPDTAPTSSISSPLDELEDRDRMTTDSGEVWERVVPKVHSAEDLLTYRDLKIAEAREILESTRDRTEEKPYYQAVITMLRPIPLSEVLELIKNYNVSMAKALRSDGAAKHIPKADLVPGEDALIVNVVRFVSTSGRGQLTADTLSNPQELARLESEIGNREKTLGGAQNFKLIEGVTSILGGIHRDRVMDLQEEPEVFLADIGPASMYRGEVDRASWDTVYQYVEEYINQ